MSTEVYRVDARGSRFYLRIAEEPGGDLASEVEIHRRLKELGVRVPEVIHYEPLAPELGRSIAITTEIDGRSLMHCEDEASAKKVVIEVGRDLARISSITVEGYGWIRDTPSWPLEGELESWEEWMAFGLDHLERLDDFGIPASAQETIHSVREAMLREPFEPYLVHGDMDLTPIFHAGDIYTGIIDLGEVRGAEPYYDLAHFLLHDGMIVEFELLPELLRGYSEIATFDDGLFERINDSAVLIASRQLLRWHGRFGTGATKNQYFTRYRDRAIELIASIQARYRH